MKTKGRKPKFRQGQVVVIRNGYQHAGHYGRIEGMFDGKDNLHYGLSPEGIRAVEFALRPLTAREIGERALPSKTERKG